MKIFTDPLDKLADIDALRASLKRRKHMYELSGVVDSGKAQVIYALSQDADFTLIVTETEKRARELVEEYSFFEPDVVYFPAKDMLFYQSDVQSNTLSRERIRAIKSIIESDHATVITTLDALMNRIPPAETIMDNIITLRSGDEIDLTQLRKQLVSMGYEAVNTVESPGEFAVRGGILDIFPLTDDEPVRIELWDTEIDTIRSFETTSQKSNETLDEVQIVPAMELVITEDEMWDGLNAMEADKDILADRFDQDKKYEESHRIRLAFDELKERLISGSNREAESRLMYFTDETYSLLDYLPEDALVFMDEPARLIEHAHILEQEFSESMIRREEQGYCLPKQKHMLFSSDSVAGKCFSHPGVLLTTLDTGASGINDFKPKAHYYIRMVPVTSYNNSIESLVSELKGYIRKKYKIVLISSSRTRSNRLTQDLQDMDLNAFYSEDYDHDIYPGEILVTVGSLRKGYEYPDSGYVFIAESDIFGAARKKKKKKKRYAPGEKINGFGDLNVGDYVVHENYGVGIYQGIEQIEVDHTVKDYLKITYAKGSNLYILTSQLDMISKYGNVGDKKPKLSTLGSPEWAKTKSRVQKAVTDVAKDLVDLYALRQKNQGYVYGPDTVWQKEFEETFPYEETDSQLQAIEDVKNDMESPKIMDRLICGDVGYGKTEIAIRAAFKAVQENKQVVYLAPTTILAQQHYNTFKQRMKDYPVNIEMMSRFRTPAENKKTAKLLKDGMVDIVIGTHRVLSKDVGFKDLGLLIIDEEQRFGVENKEQIKKLKKNVDVLSLSATPIPRTLHMSLTGIRDMSLLEEAPMERTPIQTYVFEQNDEMVREAIEREMDRGGQVYYVINRVKEIADVAAKVQQLVPDANVAYIHGKMPKTQVEEIMADFLNKDIDVLVATTIIEIGLDISNVNTIIISDADKLGLSQLYQLRGRVGRSNRTAYAFLMYRRDRMLSEVAEKRLSAIKQFTELGSGFKIAMQDLEIRGAGNLLGEAQSGHMEAVGYELYCKMLNMAVSLEKGEDSEEHFETSVDIKIDAYIPSDYITDEEAKLDMYKRISGITSDEEEMDILDELIDRFGEPGRPVRNLLTVARLRRRAHAAYITDIKQAGRQVRISLYQNARLDPSGFPDLIASHTPYLAFTADAKAPYFMLDYGKNNKFKEKDLPEYLISLCDEIARLKINNSDQNQSNDNSDG